MSLDRKQKTELLRQLDCTQTTELDCDEFAKNIAAYVDDGIEDEKLALLMKHHEEFCPECAEEVKLLLKSLGR